jgi:hypothetical protein
LLPWCSSDQYCEQDIMLGNPTATRTEAFDQQPLYPPRLRSVELFDEMAAKVKLRMFHRVTAARSVAPVISHPGAATGTAQT